jgi:Domain of unknown function (DUF1854)
MQPVESKLLITPTEPPPLRMERRGDGRLCAAKAGALIPVRPVRCFPWSSPGAYISLRDDEDNEVALVADPASLDGGSRMLLEAELAQASFVLHIRRILAVEEELEIRVWKVETREGARTFQTARDEWPWPLPGGSLLLRDVAGDLYLVPRTAELDPTSRKIFWPFMD